MIASDDFVVAKNVAELFLFWNGKKRSKFLIKSFSEDIVVAKTIVENLSSSQKATKFCR